MSKVGGKTGSKNSVLAFLNCMDGSVLAFLKWMDGSVLVSLKCPDSSVLANRRFSIQSAPLDFHSRGILMYHSYYERKAPKCHVWKRMTYLVTPEAQYHLPLATLPCLPEKCNHCGKNFKEIPACLITCWWSVEPAVPWKYCKTDTWPSLVTWFLPFEDREVWYHWKCLFKAWLRV